MKHVPDIYRTILFVGCEYGSHAGNMLYSSDNVISASCMIPDNMEVSEDYGYLTLKEAIIADLEAHGYATEDLRWNYDPCDYFAEDASADLVPGYTMEVNIDYEELESHFTYGDYFEEHDDENFSWCKPYTDETEDYWLVIYDGEVEQIKSPTYTTDPVNYERPDEDRVERFAREVNPDYDLYSGWSDTHIALEKMHETGCAHCPWFDECQAMGERMQDGDCR